MKSTAFIIRVGICLLLSLVPLSELENRIYSIRMEHRTQSTRLSQVLIVETDRKNFNYFKILNQNPVYLINTTKNSWGYLQTDPDGVIRRATVSPNGKPSPAYETYSKIFPNRRLPSSLLNQPHLIYFSGPPQKTFQRCSVSYQHNSCPNFRDRIVLLVDESDSDNLRHTPLGDMSPAEITAHDIDTLILEHPIYSISIFEQIIICTFLIFLGAFYILYYPVVISAIAISGTGIVLVLGLFPLIFQFFDIYIPSSSTILSLLVTYLVFTGYRMARQENLQWRSLKQAQYLKELDRMKTNFLTLMSHDLKTPLAKIQAVVERLRREMLLPPENRSDWKELLDSIENSNNEMTRFITSIINLSKIESQKVILNKKSNDMNSLIQQALKRLRPIAQQKNISISENLDPLFSIECDEDLMRQVLTNLIDNAIKYSPPGAQVIVRSFEEDGFLRVEVEDFGPGIPKDQLPLMFRKFSRFLQPIQSQVKGTGLGLYLSKFFIELHGGTIKVKSIEGRGTTFSFTLPLNGAESETLLG